MGFLISSFNKNYEKRAKDFLKKCNASMNFLYLGCNQNDLWEEPFSRDNYIVNIVTPKGNMQVKFWDSKNNTDKNLQRKCCGYSRIYPTAYDVLSCLQKYDVGDIEDFMFEYGYTLEKKGDLKRIQAIYEACKKEYEDICRCFTEKQIEELQEIQ